MAAHFDRRLRKAAVTTTVAAVAVAALSASQAPNVTADAHGRQTTADKVPTSDTPSEESATGNSPYYTDLPPLDSPSPAPTIGTPASRGPSEAGIPATVLDAYKKAESALRRSKPGCNLPWQLLAAIGKVESGQARGGRVDAQGNTSAGSSARSSTATASRSSRTPTTASTTATAPMTTPSAHAVHPLHLGLGGPRRQRRRQGGPEQHL